MKSFNVPGIYISKEKIEEPCVDPLGPKATGFLGLTEKGPLNTPVHIKSFKDFQDIFGEFTDYSYLPFSVYGFFQTGGIECYVVRVGHIDEKDGIKHSSAHLIDNKERKSFNLQSKTPGSWGNDIHLRLWHTTGLSEELSSLPAEDSKTIYLKYEHDFVPGDYVKLNFNAEEVYRIISVNDNKIILNKKIVRNLHTKQFFVSEVLINMELTYNKTCEAYNYLSVNPDRKNFYFSSIYQKSNLVDIKIEDNGCPMEFNGYLSSGRDGLLSLTPGDFIGHYKGLKDYRGLGCFESIEGIALLACPDSTLFYSLIDNSKQEADNSVLAIHEAMIAQCENMLNRFAILDFDGSDTQEILKLRESYDTKNAAMYYPLLKIVHPADLSGFTTVNIPPSGHMAGLYTYCDKTEGLYRAPANLYLLGAVGLSREVDDDEYSLTYSKGVNSFKVIPGRGVKPWGAKTLSSDKNWSYINVRRSFIGIKHSVKNSSSWAVFEINDKNLRKRLIRFLTAFLLELWRDGYLKGATPEDAFFVKCDSENNSPRLIDEGRIQVDIGVSIVKPAEYINIKLLGNSENAAVTLMDEQ